MNYEETLSELQGLLGKVVFVGVGPYARGGPAYPVVAGVVGELKRAESGIMWTADPGDEHVAFEIGDLRSNQGGFITLVRSLFTTAEWVDAPGGRELAIIQGPSSITVGQTP